MEAVIIKNIPNIISMTRILLSLYLLMIDPYQMLFFVIYFGCVISDVLDGYFARKYKVMSSLGATLDSMADIIFGAAIFFILINTITLPMFLWKYIIAVFLIRFLSVGVTFYRFHEFAMIHTYGNKVCGLLIVLFVPFAINGINLLIATVLTVFAGLAAVEELFIQITTKKLDKNRKSIFVLKSNMDIK